MENAEPTTAKTEALIVENKTIDDNTKSLLMLLKKLLIEEELSSSILNKFSIKLSENDKVILSKILEHSPKVFDNIEEAMKKIIVDGKIDSKDLPYILACIQELYQLIYTFKTYKMDTKKRCELCATLIKMVIRILVEERIVKLDEEKKVEFLSNTDFLVDSAINLIGLSKVIKPSGCIKKLFGKKK
jgi:uncharacterized protein (DUF1778 family)